MRAALNFLSEGEVEKTHEASLRILKETGVKIHSEKVRRLLAENGAEVDGEILQDSKLGGRCFDRSSTFRPHGLLSVIC